jgi:hypothetical protein
MLKPFAMDATLAPICNDLPPSLERKRQETPYDSHPAWSTPHAPTVKPNYETGKKKTADL